MKHTFYITMPLLAVMILLVPGRTAFAQGNGGISNISNPPDISGIDFRSSNIAIKEVAAGDLCFIKNAPQEAIEHYKKAADAWPYPSVYTGLGKAYVALGNYNYAVAAYRTLFEGSTLKVQGGGEENNPQVLMHYSLALSKTGKDAEALDICRRALQLLSAESSQRFSVPLPDIGNERINRLVSRKRLQAIAHVGIALSHNGFVAPEEWQVKHARTAAETQPEADWTHYYYGRALANRDGAYQSPESWRMAKDELTLAIRLGKESTKKEVESFVKDRPAIGLK